MGSNEVNENSILLNQTSLSPPLLTESSNVTRLNIIEQQMKDMSQALSLLRKKNFVLEQIVTDMRSKIEDNENYIKNQDIYSRRNNVEICNIPESVDDNLEEFIIKMLKSTNMDISSYDIVAVHRLGKKTNRTRNVIVRFLNRKDAYKTLKLNQKLKSIPQYKKIYITENLCPINKKIFNALYKLKKSEVIIAVWSFNGNVYYKIEEEDEFQQASSLQDIQFLFDENSENSVNVNNDAAENSRRTSAEM